MSSNIRSFEGEGFMGTKNRGWVDGPPGSTGPESNFWRPKRLTTVDSISLSFKTLLSLVEKLFWSICSVTTFGAGKIAKICSKLYAMLGSDINVRFKLAIIGLKSIWSTLGVMVISTHLHLVRTMLICFLLCVFLIMFSLGRISWFWVMCLPEKNSSLKFFCISNALVLFSSHTSA